MCKRQFVVSQVICILPPASTRQTGASFVQQIDEDLRLDVPTLVAANVAPVIGRAGQAPAQTWRGSPALITRSGRASIVSLVVLALGCTLGVALYLRALTAVGASGVDQSAMFAVLIGAAVSSIAGFAFSPICGAMLVHIVDGPVHIVQILLVCSIGTQLLMVWSLRGAISWRLLVRFLAGGFAGLPIGLWLLLHLPQKAYAQALGILIVGCATWRLLRRHIVLPERYPAGDVAVGVSGGIIGGLAGFPSALVTIWCGMQGWDKVRQRSVIQPFILGMQVLTLAALYVTGSTGHSVTIDLSAWIYLPAALFGAMCGLAIFRRLNDGQFALAANLLLIVSGVTMAV
jgi:uncharacterized protein